MKTQIKQIVLCLLAACFFLLLGGCGEIGTGCINHLKENKILETKKSKLTVENGKLKSYPGARFKINIKGVDFVFRWCPAGSFIKGSPENEWEPSANEKQNNLTEKQNDVTEEQSEVEIPVGFWILETEVTLEMFFKAYKGKDVTDKTKLLPATTVSYEDALKFCEWLQGEISSKWLQGEINSEIHAQIRDKKLGYKVHVELPTEEQWEYSCRAGTTTAYFWGGALKDKSHANFDCSKGFDANAEPGNRFPENNEITPPEGPVDVRSYCPNDWGIYDMHGNVEEWCRDFRVRGGSWKSKAWRCRSAKRDKAKAEEECLDTRGFRVVLTISFADALETQRSVSER